MKDWIIPLILAIFGIIGYAVMGRIDKSIERHIPDSAEEDQEEKTDEPSENG